MHDTPFRRPARLASALCVAALVAAATARTAEAAWPSAPTPNLAVNTATGAQNYRVAISDGAGGMFVTWSDTRFIVSDCYVQHVTAAGTLTWNPNGQSVCAAAGRQESPALAADGIGGLVSTWRDYRAGSEGDLWAQRVDASGVIQWAFNGVRVCGAIGPQSAPVIVADGAPDTLLGAQGSIIAWSDERDTPRIYAQRLRSNGNTVWIADGMPLSNSPGAQFDPAMIPDGAGGAIVAWSQQTVDGDDVWAQRVDGSGNAMWGPAGIRLCGAAGEQFLPLLVNDGGGGAWLAWQDGRDGRIAIYAQHVDGDGTPLLAADGEVVCATTKDQLWPAIAPDGVGGLFVAWTDYRTNADLYAQRLSSSGSRLWASGGVAVSTGSGSHAFPSVVADGTGGTTLAWEDSRSGLDIYAQRLDPNGNAQWAVGGAAISTAGSNQYQVTAVSNGDGTAILLWSDTRGGTVDLYAQRVPLDATATQVLASRVLSAQPNPARESATFAFELEAPGRGELTVFDAAGRRVRTVTRSEFSVGDHRVAWDARDDAGRRCAEGVYFARLVMDGRTVATRRVAITR